MNEFNSEITPKVKISLNFRLDTFQIKYSQKNFKHGNILHKFFKEKFQAKLTKNTNFQ